MPSIGDTARRFLYGIPSIRTERIQMVKGDILDQIEAEGWDWAEVEEATQVAQTELKNGNLPPAETDVQACIRSICENYQSKGCPIEDLRDAVDRVKAKASAKQSMEHQIE